MKLKRIICIIFVFVLTLCSFGLSYAAQPDKAILKVADISKWNKSINWSVTAEKLDAVIMRIGYRGNTYRNIVEDELFVTHYNNAISYNLPVGVYFYSCARTVEESVEEANWVIQKIEEYSCSLEMPVYIDMEDTYVQDNLSDRLRTDIALAFCKTMKDNGFYAGVYANKYWLTELIKSEELYDYTIWVAQYNNTCTYAGNYDMWQYTETGKIDGIDGFVDLNVCYCDFPKFIREYGYNNLSGEAPPPVEVDASALGTYKITADSMNVRSGPGVSNSVLGTIPTGREVYIHTAKDSWGAFQFGDTIGWISLNSAYEAKLSNHITTSEGIGYYRVDTAVLNSRSGPSTEYDIINKFNSGDRLFISELEGNWGCYYYGYSKKGWVCLDYAKFIGTVSYDSATAQSGRMPTQEIEIDKSASLYKCSYSLPGQNFLGWSKVKGKNVDYTDGATIKMGNSNVVLYAVFSDKESESFSLENGATVYENIIRIPNGAISSSKFIDKYISLKDGATAKVKCLLSDVAGTGSTVSITCNGVTADYIISVRGDSNGDGECDALDLADAIEIAQKSKPQTAFNLAQLFALDVDSSDYIDEKDISVIKPVAFGLSDLS